jgi:Terminase large subunit, T4likevirus-type, N-terminal
MKKLSNNEIIARASKVISPQQGFQYDFLSSSADIVIGGGAAGAGKTFALLLEAARNVGVHGFGGVIFRRTTPQIFNPGGLWDKSLEIFTHIGGSPKESRSEWEFLENNRIKFNHLEYEKNLLDHQGAEYAFIGFDELTHFSKSMFFYMLSRNRSKSGVRPYVRATCNPDPDSWLAEFLSWWIDQETGYPIPERSGVLRYMIQDGDKIVWGDSIGEVIDRCPHIFSRPELQSIKPEHLVKSVTFVPGKIEDNPELIKVNPQYLGNLLSLSEEDQFRLLRGNWKIRQDGTSLFNYTKLKDIFSNFVKKSKNKFITCDAARFGRDLAVIMTWIGYKVVRIQILTKSKTTDITEAIENERERMGIPVSHVLVDQDGVGGGVVDEGGYLGFSGNATSLPDPKTEVKENYLNLKTQCYYRFATKVNEAKIAISLDDVVVDGEQSMEVRVGEMVYDIKKLIIDDLRSVKRKNSDKEGKLQINSKEEQKNLLGGRSPDFGDCLMMRVWFYLNQEPEPDIRVIG